MPALTFNALNRTGRLPRCYARAGAARQKLAAPPNCGTYPAVLNSSFTMVAFSGVLWSISPLLFTVHRQRL
jgi:hypothetical protein